MLRLPPGLSVPLFNVKVIADGEKLKIDVGMLTAQLASYEPELDISQGYTPEPGEHPASQARCMHLILLSGSLVQVQRIFSGLSRM